MKQNKYDNPAFFEKYSRLPRSLGGLEEAMEWPAFRDLLPALRHKRLLDLGCGFGWHCRYARQQKAQSVVGVDLSEKMLARARMVGEAAGIEYLQTAIEDINFPADTFDVISSLALHYVSRFDLVCQRVNFCLADGGSFVISIEHPMYTARAAQDWCYGGDGERLHWPVDHYLEEGPRDTQWLCDDVVKYHRTISTYIDTLIDAGFCIVKVLEPGPSAEMLAVQPECKDERRRSVFLLIAAVKAPVPLVIQPGIPAIENIGDLNNSCSI